MSFEPVFAPSDPSRPRITIHPQREEAQAPEPRWKKSFQKATLGDTNGKAWGGNGFGVDDFLDLINPLQHIPVVGTIYREITGDTATSESKIIGGAIFGGPIGMLASAVSAIIEHESGQSITQTAMALVSDAPKPTQIAQKHPIAVQEHQLTAFNIPAPMPPKAVAPATLADLIPQETATPAAVLPPLSEEQQKHDAILQLFDDNLASLTEQVQHDQHYSYTEQVKSALKG